MREIKFRAWDIERKFMCNDEGLGDNIEGRVCWDFCCVPTQIINFALESSPEYIFMQYTGIKDKNGKEIYEGDIISVDWRDTRYPKHNIGPVKWDNDNISFFLGEGAGPKRDAEKYMEVIGNIHENPELLNS